MFNCVIELEGRALLNVALYVIVLRRKVIDRLSEAGSKGLQRTGSKVNGLKFKG